MIDWLATWKQIADIWMPAAGGEDPDWVGDKLCALVQCGDEAELRAWAEDVGFENVETLIVWEDAK